MRPEESRLRIPAEVLSPGIGEAPDKNPGGAAMAKGPRANSDSATTNEDSLTTIDVLKNDSGDGLSLVSFSSRSVSGAAISLNPDGTLSYDPSGVAALQALSFGSSLTDSFSYVIRSSTGQTATGKVSVKVQGVNDAPDLSPSAVSALASITEDGPLSANKGTSVASFAKAAITDADRSAKTGIAVTAADTAHGHWEYSLTKGKSWIDLDHASVSSAVLLPETALIRFVPNPDYSGPAEIAFHAWDQSSGKAGATMDLGAAGATGGGSAFSAAEASATITVTAQDDPVIARDDAYEATEDTPLTASAAEGLLANDTAVDGGVAAVAGTFTTTAGGSVNIAADGSFVYTPKHDFFGEDSFTYMVTDANGSTAIANASLTVAEAPKPPQGPERVSLASDGTQANGDSFDSSVSADGRYETFLSNASNLVEGDTNGWADVFVRDWQVGTTERISVASDGTQGDNFSNGGSVSADGRYVAFWGAATNLVEGDTNGVVDVFVHDRQTGTTERISVASDGTQANNHSFSPCISANGRYIAYTSQASNLDAADSNSSNDVYVYDRQTGSTELVSVANDGTQGDSHSSTPSLSEDGRYVAFHSIATNLVEGDTNNWQDVFVYDRQTDTTERVSVASDGTQANSHCNVNTASISADGRYIVFDSAASDLVDGDTNGVADIFVRDRQTGITERVSVASDGTQGNGHSGSASISADGRYISFGSIASNLVEGDTNETGDIFVYDRQTGTTKRISVASDGTQGNSNSFDGMISADGHYVTYTSYATNLVAGDTNGESDVFVSRIQDWFL